MTQMRKLLLLVAAGITPFALVGIAAAVEGDDVPDATVEATAADSVQVPDTCDDEATTDEATTDEATTDEATTDDEATEADDDEATEADDDEATEADDSCDDATEVVDPAVTEDADTEDAVDDAAVVTEEGTRPENHGFYVSEAARTTCPAGPGHGACVREVAQGDDGKPDHGDETTVDATDEDGGDDQAVVEDDGTADEGAPATGSAARGGPKPGKGHGR